MRRFSITVLVLAAAAALLAGCGEDKEAFRVNKFNPAEEKLEAERSALSQVLRTVRLKSKSDEKRMNAQIDKIAKAAADVAKLEPPNSVHGLFIAYNSANLELIAQLREFAKTLREGKKKKLDTLAEDAQESAGKVHRAEQALREALS